MNETRAEPHGEVAASDRPPVVRPRCRSMDVAVYLWGEPAFSDELEQDIGAGRVVIGGCVVSEEDPIHRCRACGMDFDHRTARYGADEEGPR
jgi:hypothetical protein